MAFYKAATEQPFTIISNEILQDDSLTPEATGLLAFMLSLPENWKYNQEWLQKQKQKLGRDKLARILKELELAGYLVRKHKQAENGRMAGHDWVIYPTKQLQANKISTSTESLKTRDSVFPRLGNTEAINKHKNKKTSVLVNAEDSATTDDFNFDLVLSFILTTFRQAGYDVDNVIDQAYITESLKEYQASQIKRPPTQSGALSHVDIALRNRHGIVIRSGKAAAARDKLNSAVVNQLNTQAQVIEQHTRNAEQQLPKIIADKMSRDWAEGLE